MQIRSCALHLKWDEIGELGEDGASARLEDSKTGPRTIWLGPEAARVLAALPRPEGSERVFPEDLTSQRLYTFWCGIREQAELPDLRIHDCRHTWASQGVMNGVGLTTVGRMLGHRNRETTAIYAHLDDTALRDAAAQAASVIAQAMNYKAEPAPLPEEEQTKDGPMKHAEHEESSGLDSLDRLGTPLRLGTGISSAEATQPKPGRLDRPGSPAADLADRPADSDSDKADEDHRERHPRDLLWM